MSGTDNLTNFEFCASKDNRLFAVQNNFFLPLFCFFAFLSFQLQYLKCFDRREVMQTKGTHSLWSWDVFLNVHVLIKFKEQPIIPGLKCHREIAAENPQALE